MGLSPKTPCPHQQEAGGILQKLGLMKGMWPPKALKDGVEVPSVHMYHPRAIFNASLSFEEGPHVLSSPLQVTFVHPPINQDLSHVTKVPPCGPKFHLD